MGTQNVRRNTRWSFSGLVREYGEEKALLMLQDMPGLGMYGEEASQGWAGGGLHDNVAWRGHVDGTDPAIREVLKDAPPWTRPTHLPEQQDAWWSPTIAPYLRQSRVLKRERGE